MVETAPESAIGRDPRGDGTPRERSGEVKRSAERSEPKRVVNALAKGELHLWRLGLDLRENDLYYCYNLLSPTEIARALHFQFERDRRRFSISRGLLRAVLASYLDCSPKEVSLVPGLNGKPMLQEAEVQFNLTHCKDIAVLAVTRQGQVGVDLERVRPIANMSAMMEMFSPGERLAIGALSPYDHIRGFFRCWTRKEAYLKAIGEGITANFDRFEVTVDPDTPPRLVWADDLMQSVTKWHFSNLDIDHNYVGAVAVAGDIRSIRWFSQSTTDLYSEDRNRHILR